MHNDIYSDNYKYNITYEDIYGDTNEELLILTEDITTEEGLIQYGNWLLDNKNKTRGINKVIYIDEY